ncbi:MAG: alpha/beta hydrolase fold domain-containing protein [Lentisphaeria bacterium]|nr:alpha/beta hydrolase fold domain-containing protein [Lentisphaeria bacterium]
MKSLFLLIAALFCGAVLCAKDAPDATVPYKNVNGEELKFHIFYPENFDVNEKRPLVLMFHGGGWRAGSPEAFYPHCRYFSNLGYVAISATYRLCPAEKPQNTPFHCLEDAKSAVRYLKTHAAEFGIDPDRIITSGSSAGGQLAIAVAVCDEVNDPNDDTSISPVPAAAILYRPVLNAGPDGYAPIYRRIKDNFKPFSPMHNLEGKKLPAQIILIGNSDHVIPVPQAKAYQEIARKLKISSKAVDNSLQRIRKKLRRALAK